MQLDIKLFIKHFPTFGRLSIADGEQLLSYLKVRSVPAATVLTAPGQDADALFFIWEGCLGVSLATDGSELELGEFGAGSWVGEMAMVEPGPAIATVTAKTESTVLVLTHDKFIALRHQRPSLTSLLLQVFCRNLAGRLRSTVAHVDTALKELTPKVKTTEWQRELGQQLLGLPDK